MTIAVRRVYEKRATVQSPGFSVTEKSGVRKTLRTKGYEKRMMSGKYQAQRQWKEGVDETW